MVQSRLAAPIFHHFTSDVDSVTPQAGLCSLSWPYSMSAGFKMGQFQSCLLDIVILEPAILHHGALQHLSSIFVRYGPSWVGLFLPPSSNILILLSVCRIQCGANFRSFSDSWYGGASPLHSIPGQSNELLAQKYDGIIYILLRPSSAVANWVDDAILTFLQCRFIPCAGQKCRQSIANLSKFTILTLLPELTTSPLILDRPHTSWL